LLLYLMVKNTSAPIVIVPAAMASVQYKS